MPQPELKSCPFCTSLDLDVNSHGASSGRRFYVSCLSCEADGPPRGSRSEAVTAWNRRPNGDGHA
jgi:Lar family restriction alleviation protein